MSGLCVRKYRCVLGKPEAKFTFLSRAVWNSFTFQRWSFYWQCSFKGHHLKNWILNWGLALWMGLKAAREVGMLWYPPLPSQAASSPASSSDIYSFIHWFVNIVWILVSTCWALLRVSVYSRDQKGCDSFPQVDLLENNINTEEI